MLFRSWWAPFQRSLDRAAYALTRLAILGVIVFFLGKILSPLGGVTHAEDLLAKAGIFPSPDDLLTWSIWLVFPLLLIKGVWRCFTWVQGLPAKILYFLWALLIVLWVITLVLFCLTRPVGGDLPALTDRLGYLVGLAAGCLIWSLHSTIHKGLIQMWHYTRGEGTAIDRI